MASLWIREYDKVPVARSFGFRSALAPSPMAKEPALADQRVTFAASVQSASFNVAAKFIALIADVPFHYVVGANPTATTNALKVPADTLIYIGVEPGQKIAAIAA